MWCSIWFLLTNVEGVNVCIKYKPSLWWANLISNNPPVNSTPVGKLGYPLVAFVNTLSAVHNPTWFRVLSVLRSTKIFPLLSLPFHP